MNIHFIGTGSAEPDAHRANTSLLLDFDSKPILVDCSGSPSHSILAAGFPLESLTDVILTHAHTDHLYALPSLVHGLWMHGGIGPGKALTVHAPDQVVAVAQQLLDAFTLRTRQNAIALSWHPLPTDRPAVVQLDLPDWEVESFPVTHAGIDAIGLRLTRSGSTEIVYSGDCIVDDLLLTQVRPATQILIQDCGGGLNDTPGHAGAEGVRRLTRTSSLSTLILVHLPPGIRGKEAAIRDALARDFRGDILIPGDGDIFEAA